MTVERELGSGAAMASVCFASHRTLESKTKQPTVQAGKLIKVCARRWVRRTDSVGSSCASPNSQNEFWARVRLKGDLQCSFRCYQCSERINTNLPFLLNRPKQAFYTSRRLRFAKVILKGKLVKPTQPREREVKGAGRSIFFIITNITW